MIIWGGYYLDNLGNPQPLNTGGRYDPGTDSWTATSTANAPTARAGHTAVWTGREMIVWGVGSGNTGGRYNPGTHTWTATSTTNAPTRRNGHTAVWTGSEMIVWVDSSSNALNTGGRYCASQLPPQLPPQLGNISTRAFVQTGDNVMIGGFIVQGTEPKRVIIRAIGPELTQYGVPNAMGNPPPGFGIGGRTIFNDTSSAGGASIGNGSYDFGINGDIGSTFFNDASTADHASISNYGAGGSHGDGGQTIFNDTSTAGNASIDNFGSGPASTAGSALTIFNDASTAGHATITNQAGDIGGETIFTGSSTAGSSTLIANEGFYDTTSAIIFDDASTGGTARVKVLALVAWTLETINRT